MTRRAVGATFKGEAKRGAKPKYLIQATHTAEKKQGPIQDKATGRKAAVSKALEAIGERLQSIYYSFGECDVIPLVEVSDNVSAATIAFNVSSSGAYADEADSAVDNGRKQALAKTIEYRPPGG